MRVYPKWFPESDCTVLLMRPNRYDALSINHCFRSSLKRSRSMSLIGRKCFVTVLGTDANILISKTMLIWFEIRSLILMLLTILSFCRVITRSSVWPDLSAGPLTRTLNPKVLRRSRKRAVSDWSYWSMCRLKSPVIISSALFRLIFSNNWENVSKNVTKDPDGVLIQPYSG